MKKIALTSLIASFSLFLEANSLSTYAGYINYNDSLKQKGYYSGFYGSYFKSPYKLELDLSHMNINYKDKTPDYKQIDLTLATTYYIGYNTALKLGIHNMIIDQKDNPNNYDNVVFAGVSYYKLYNYNLGLDIYRSDYDGFNVVQISPKYGFNFGDFKSKIGSFYAQAQLNFINISKKGISSKQNYANLDLKLQNFNGPITTEIFASIGKNAYKVAKGGFAVYNLKEEYKYTYGASIAYNFKDNSNLKATYSKSKFSEANQDAKSNNYMLGFSKSW